MSRDQTDETRHRRRRRGCRGFLLGVAVLLVAVTGLGFTAWLVQGPRIHTQYSHTVEINELRLDDSSAAVDKPLETKQGQKSIYYSVIGFADIDPNSFEIAISYRYTDTGQRYSRTFVVSKIKEKEMCWFATILKP